MAEPKYTNISAQNRNAAIEQELVKELDIALVTGSDIIEQFDADLTAKKSVLFELEVINLNGVNAVAKLQHSISGKPNTFKDMPSLSQTIAIATDTYIFEATDFSAKFIRMVFIKNAVTTGKINIIALAKD